MAQLIYFHDIFNKYWYFLLQYGGFGSHDDTGVSRHTGILLNKCWHDTGTRKNTSGTEMGEVVEGRWAVSQLEAFSNTAYLTNMQNVGFGLTLGNCPSPSGNYPWGCINLNGQLPMYYA